MYVHTLNDSLRYSQISYLRPRIGEELLMIAFWESELEGRKVICHSLTTEDTGEDVLVISAHMTIAYMNLKCPQA